MQTLLVIATVLQLVAVGYGVLLLRRHRAAGTPWFFLLATLLSMLSWRVVITTGISPGPWFTTVIAIWGSVGALLAMFFFGRDATLRARAERERDDLLQRERAARLEAERASQVKDRFLATLSHELRTPLTAILGWCAILRATDLSGEADRGLEIIERNARAQARLVEDLLDATRIQTGALQLDRSPLAFGGPVAAAVEAIRPHAALRRIIIDHQADTDTPMVFGDASRLQQVVSNLLVNAVKFSPDGATVRVLLERSATDAVLRIVDTGVGIPHDFLPQLFQPFQQADASHTRRHAGLGLGLSIVATLVRMHDGHVEAASDGPGHGAVFIVRLPIWEPATAARRAPPTVEPDAPAARLDGTRILVVDDEPDVRTAVVTLLERHGATVTALDSGAGIEAALRASRPHVLLFDIGMPVEDGYALLRRVRALPDGAEVPAVSLTAHAREEERRRALAAGFAAHLPKPLDVHLLVTTLCRLTPSAGITTAAQR